MTNITKDEYLKAIRERRIHFAVRKETSNGYTHFMPYQLYVADDMRAHMVPIVCEESAYWDKKTHDYRCIAWGTNRVLEIFLAIGYALGCEFSEMSPQVSSTL